MQAQLKIQGPIEIVCRTPLEGKTRREADDPIYHECLAFGGSLKFAHDKRVEGRFDHAIFLAEIAPRAVSGFEGRAQQIYVTRLVALIEAVPQFQPAGAKKPEPAGAAK